MSEPEILLLLQKYLDDDLDGEEIDALSTFLRRHGRPGDPLGRDLTDGIWMHCLLGRYFHGEKLQFTADLFKANEPVIEALDPDELARLAAASPALPATPHADRKPAKPAPAPKAYVARKSSRLLWLAIPGLLLLAFLIYDEFRRAATTNATGFTPVARVVDCVEPVWEDETFKPGRELGPDRLKLRSGVVKLAFADGAQVTLEGPTELLVKGNDEAFCQNGRLSVFVPSQAVGFEIGSPMAAVVDLGTAFSMLVTPERSDVHVLEGKVELQTSKKTKQSLAEGLAARIDFRGSLETLGADAETFLGDERLRTLKTAYVEKRRPLWNEQEERLRSDPALVYRLDPETVRGLARAAGSREGKPAVRFRNSRDRLPVSASTECRDLTLIASVRPESLDAFANTLLMGDAFDAAPGEFHWQFNRFGVLQFHLNAGGRSPEQFNSPDVIARKDCRTWLTLAVVADAKRKTVTHYLDGRPVASMPWKDPIPLRLDRLTIGNEQYNARKATSRSFHGTMEDFYIFSRALTDEEIRQHYENSL